MSEDNNNLQKQVLPLIPLRGLVVFPYMILHFDVGRPKSIKALEQAMVDNQLIFLIAQKDMLNDDPEPKDIYDVGTICKVKQLLKLPGDNIRVLVEGISRAKITHINQTEPFFMCELIKHEEKKLDYNEIEMEAVKREVHSVFNKYYSLSNKITPETMVSIMEVEDLGQLADIIAANIMLKPEDKQEILNEFDAKARLEKLIIILTREIEVLKAEKSISKRVRKQVEKNQREYYLREQLKAIEEELGDKEGVSAEVKEYKTKITQLGLAEDVEKKVVKEAERLLKIPSGSPEGFVVRNYLDLVLDLPWNKTTEERFDIKQAEKILEQEHYGLKKVKARVLEYLSVRHLTKNVKSPILCLVGPPGVGKTSIVKSIAKALNRKYVRMSLGGVRDEAEIRGHRKTYVGAMPGRIINALKQARSKNALILMDEIDKMSNDFRGDPAAALLEVLDAEQNFEFRDHYLEVPFNLNEVMFITTANTLETIPRPLLDRMEVISISGYTEEEKLNIATKYLLPKQMKNHGLNKSKIRINEKTIKDIISYYTREAGVRNLEREIGNVCRKVARIIIENNQKSVTVSNKNIEKFLGTKKYRFDLANEKDEIGVVRGLAWTSVGGDTLSIEANVMDGDGKVELTGHLGDVMKESAKAAISYIRSKAEQLGIDKTFYKNKDIHVHVPEGAIPKDGPSAGITIATALISALSGIPVRRDVAMTGEITIRGRILPIGGLKEKSLAAYRAGINTIVIPSENNRDLDEIPENIRKKIKFVLADDMRKVLKTVLKYSGKTNSNLYYDIEKDKNKTENPPIKHIPDNVNNDIPVMKQ